MDYGNLLQRAWTLVWEHKYLMGLGILAALGGSGVATPNASYQLSDEEAQGLLNLSPQTGQFEPWMGLAAGAMIALIGFFLVIGLLVWAVSTVARGGLIAGVDTHERGGISSFGVAWLAGWQRIGTLIGIGLVPLIPVILLSMVGIAVGGLLYMTRAVVQGGPAVGGMGGVATAMVGLLCIGVPIALALALLSTFANRACMLEETGVWASYQRGWSVLRANLGGALILFLLQIGISVGLGILLLIPGIVVALCCLLWPLMLLVEGAITAYFSTVWTLAWREWTGRQFSTAVDAI